jgi:hypothetical protein
VALALYGDLAKRFLQPGAALAVLYGLTGVILVALVVSGNNGRKPISTPISSLAGLLIGVYLAQLLTSPLDDIAISFSATAYVCVPLAFVFLIPRVYPQFDLRALALYVTILMVPVHAVGFIQQFVSPSFMISTAYSESGGVIIRNFLDAGTFSRFPSIFASADRYSGVAMMEFFLAFVLLSDSKPPARTTLVWVVISVVSGLGSLLIAGARSRILIVGISLTIAGLIFLYRIVRRRPSRRMTKIAVVLFLMCTMGFTIGLSVGAVRERITAFPVLAMLQQSHDRGDFTARFVQSLDLSAIPEDTTYFGEGLGTTGSAGRPGEFGIRAMWIESGLFWTPIMLLLNVGLLFWLGRIMLRAALWGDAVLAMLCTGQLLAWLLALLAGLSGTFELSQALLLFPTIAMVSMVNLASRTKRRRIALSARTAAQSFRGPPTLDSPSRVRSPADRPG